jgi:hypothetical protein
MEYDTVGELGKERESIGPSASMARPIDQDSMLRRVQNRLCAALWLPFFPLLRFLTQPQALSLRLRAFAGKPAGRALQIYRHSGEQRLQVNLGGADVASNSYPLSPYQPRKAAFDSASVLTVERFELLCLLAGTCGFQHRIVAAETDTTTAFARATLRAQGASGAACFRKAKDQALTFACADDRLLPCRANRRKVFSPPQTCPR